MSQSNANGWFIATPSSSPTYSGLYVQSVDSEMKVSTSLVPSVSFHYPNLPAGTIPVGITTSANASACFHSSRPRSPEDMGPGPSITTSDEIKGPPGANLFVFHLPNELSNWDLYLLFRRYGTILSVHTMVDTTTGLSRGFGFVSYSNAAEAKEAIAHLDGLKLGKKRLKVQQKRESLTDDLTTLDRRSQSYTSIEQAFHETLHRSSGADSDNVPAEDSHVADATTTAPNSQERRPLKLSLPTQPRTAVVGADPAPPPKLAKGAIDADQNSSAEGQDYFSASLESPSPRSASVSKSASLARISAGLDQDAEHVCQCIYCGREWTH